MSDMILRPRPVMGLAGFFLGAISLLLALMVFLSGPAVPPYAVDGHFPLDPLMIEPLSRGVGDYIHISAIVLSTMAILTGLVGLLRRETSWPVAAAMVLGSGALLFPLTTAAVLIGAAAAWKSVTSRRLSVS